ncbi:hypothetical protein [Serpentinomonas mccroryi]|uniref:hypothetical protein n=1 Tax=Serpentinimonas maccroryi TaxID=1458426 RepID=UPI0018D3E0F1
MIRLRMIDQVGSGIRRMFQTQRDRYFPLPDFVFEVTEPGHLCRPKWRSGRARRPATSATKAWTTVTTAS